MRCPDLALIGHDGTQLFKEMPNRISFSFVLTTILRIEVRLNSDNSREKTG